MNTSEIFKQMVRSFFVITTGIVFSMYIFCAIFNSDAIFSLKDIGRIIIMALLSDLPLLIFISRRELTKKQMLIRKAIHFIVLSAVLLWCGIVWDWVEVNKFNEIAVFLMTIIFVYIIVFVFVIYRDKKLTDLLNDKLKNRYH